MNAPPIPANEPQRLAALQAHAVLDTDPEEAFDAVTRAAARLLEVPIALVSFVDAERQWFKSRYGLETRQTPRAVSFCGQVVADDRPLVVEDALADTRFVDNPLVLGDPHVRFYAGLPLRTPEGLVLGTLCVIDHKPRGLSARELDVLELLAQQVVAQLDLRRQALALERERRAVQTHLQFFHLGLDMLCTTSGHHFDELNPAWEATLGYSRDELRAHPVLWFIHPDDVARTQAASRELLEKSGTVRNLENRYRHKDGHWVPLSWVCTVRDGVFYGTARDLSAHREREEQLAVSQALLEDSEAQLRSTFAAMAEGVVLQQADGSITTANPAAADILGLPQDQLLGLTSVDPRWQATRPDGAPFPGDQHPAMVSLATGQPLHDVRMGLHKASGSRAWISINSQPLVRAPGDAPWAVICTFRDITAQVEAQEALLRERTFLDAVLANIPGTLVGVFDAQLTLERYFGAASGFAGASQGLFTPALFSDKNREAYIAAARECLEGGSPRLDLTVDGRRYQVSFVPLPERRGLMLAHDVTEHDALREQLYRQERLVTAGTLTSGIGHEINNPLAYVMANLEFALEEVRALAAARPGPQFDELIEVLEASQQGAERIRKIVRGLRALAREESTPGAVNLGEVIEVSANMAQHEVKLRATLATELGAVPPVFAEEPRLTQVFVNLLVNAAQCFTTSDPRRNTIRVRTGVHEGNVFAEVSDNGPGIPPEVLPRIFDPFFTTKPVGKGTGLGLSICQAVVASFGGELTCSTAVGQGTTFRLTLRPASAAPAQPEARALKGRVLVVDDERDILAVMGRMLRNDYEVVVESDPEKALERLLGPQGHFDVIFCDVIMPKRNGVQLYRAVEAQRPQLAARFVMMSGGDPLGEVREFLVGLKTPRLEKPFDAHQVREAAEKLLGK